LLHRKIKPLLLRRTKSEVVKELPPKTEIVQKIPLSDSQKDLYETLRGTMNQTIRAAIEAKGLNNCKLVVLDALMKLRQVCCHPDLVQWPEKPKHLESSKLTHLMSLTEKGIKEGRRLLLFSSFTSMLEKIETELDGRNIRYCKITGETKDRQEEVRKFQAEDSPFPVFLISLKAGGTGLNLTRADMVIHYDPWWNPAAERQATDRAYRIGQKNPVFVYKLITEETVEDKILQLQEKKKDLVDNLLTNKGTLADLNEELIQDILNGW